MSEDVKDKNITAGTINADYIKILSDGILVKGDNIIFK